MPAPSPPTAQQWEAHRVYISEMYVRRPLKAVRAHMREAYGFNATERMFKGRFRMWGVEKNKRHNRPEQHVPAEMPAEIQDDHGNIPPSSLPDTPSESFLRQQHSNTRDTTPRSEPSPPDDDNYLSCSLSDPLSPVSIPGPLTPAPIFGERSPPFFNDYHGLNPEQTCLKIVDLASMILSRMISGPADKVRPEDISTTEDHVDIYERLNNRLRCEGQLRSLLVNRPPGEQGWSFNKPVEDMLVSFHPTTPIGVLSTLNQLTDRKAIQGLLEALVSLTKVVLPNDLEFAQLSWHLQRLFSMMNEGEFERSMETICHHLEQRVEQILKSRSLVGLYLVLLLNAKKAKLVHKTDKRIRDLALSTARYVQLHHDDKERLVLDFQRYVVSYLSMVAPEEKGVLEMANDLYARAERFYDAHSPPKTTPEDEDPYAKTYFGLSCGLLADCLYAQKDTQSQCQARGMLFQRIWCYANAPGATIANAERQMSKLKRWCEEAGDKERLERLEGVRDMIQESEGRDTREPLIPRLKPGN